MSSLHHTADPICLLCESKLTEARPELAEYFHAIKAKYPDIHISWTYRNRADQERMVACGKSKAHYPNSKHNKTTANGKPMSQAIDIFEINEKNPGGLWSNQFFKQLYSEFNEKFPHVAWGGNFKDIHDGDHFQIEIDETSGSIALPSPGVD